MLTLLLPALALAQDSPRVEQAAKAREVPAAVSAATIDWQGALAAQGRSETRSSSRFSDLVAEADRVQIPVLLPGISGTLLLSAKITSGEGWYAAQMSDETVSVTVHGNALAATLPALARELGATDAPYRTAYTDGVTTLSLSRYGVAYDVEVECRVGPGTTGGRVATGAPVEADPLVGGSACLTSSGADNLINSLEVVGGQP